MKISARAAASFKLQGQRPYQEDSRWPDTDRPSIKSRTYVVCDGVGGAAAGDVASSAVCESLADSLDKLPAGHELTHKDLRRALTNAYFALEHAMSRGSRQMATTVTLLHLHAGGATAAHAGDSRIYLFRPGSGIVYRSNDHSFVNSMVHRGMISPQQAERHPQSNIITRSLSPADKYDDRVALTVRDFHELERGDIFLLCSDGVLECTDDSQLEQIVLGAGTLDTRTARLRELCLDSHDNATAMLVEVDGIEPINPADTETDTETDTPTVTRSIGASEGITSEVSAIEPYLTPLQRLKKFLHL